jgi:hypothetical protein
LGFAPEGIGEARHADFGITGANGSGIIYAKSEPLKKIPTEDLVEEVFAEIGKYYAAGAKVIGDDAHSAEAAHWLSEDEDDLMGPRQRPRAWGPDLPRRRLRSVAGCSQSGPRRRRSGSGSPKGS